MSKKKPFVVHLLDGDVKIVKAARFEFPSKKLEVMLTEENSLLIMAEKKDENGLHSQLMHLSLESTSALLHALHLIDQNTKNQISDFDFGEDGHCAIFNIKKPK